MRYVILFSYTVFLLACNPKQDDKGKVRPQDITFNAEPYPDIDSLYRFQCESHRVENLQDTLKNNQLRLWIATPPGEADTVQIFTLKETVQGWEALFIKNVFGILKKYDKRDIVYRSETTREPDISWGEFLREVQKTGIYTLSDKNRRQSNAISCTEALQVEIVKNGKYENYEFHNWIKIEDKTQLRKIEKLIELCRQTFGFDLLKLNLDKIRVTDDCEMDTITQL